MGPLLSPAIGFDPPWPEEQGEVFFWPRPEKDDESTFVHQLAETLLVGMGFALETSNSAKSSCSDCG
ncbi:hypothetical protein V490_05946 [Pseudogymnoascus sp. VKM F-3557]|nr:hypothetical protein V490_05946 [Pseudogymnoascus sp. VKM F-3557]